jgi:hypothetical protein
METLEGEVELVEGVDWGQMIKAAEADLAAQQGGRESWPAKGRPKKLWGGSTEAAMAEAKGKDVESGGGGRPAVLRGILGGEKEAWRGPIKSIPIKAAVVREGSSLASPITLLDGLPSLIMTSS